MFDLRKEKIISLSDAIVLKTGIAYKFSDSVTGKELVAKLIGEYPDIKDIYLLSEFRKMALLSSEPEIGGVYFLATAEIDGKKRSYYVMDFIKGKTLENFLNGELSYDIVVDLISELASGMEKAHHYGIFHNDLHANNIVIDEFGHVKIIDFLWYEFDLPIANKHKQDLDEFKRHTENLINKCSKIDQQRLDIILNMCLSAKSFMGLGENIKEISSLTIDIARISNEGLLIISKLLDGMPEDLQKSHNFFMDRVPVPTSCACANSTANYIDKRIMDIQECLKRKFYEKIQCLHTAGLIDWSLQVVNDGKPNIGPYTYKFRIDIRTKAIRWKLFSKKFRFLPKPFSEPLHEFIIT